VTGGELANCADLSTGDECSNGAVVTERERDFIMHSATNGNHEQPTDNKLNCRRPHNA